MLLRTRLWLYEQLRKPRSLQNVISVFIIAILFTGSLFPIITGQWENFRICWATIFMSMSFIEYAILTYRFPPGKATFVYRALAFIIFPLYEILKFKYYVMNNFCQGLPIFEYCDLMSLFLLPALEWMVNSLEQYEVKNG